MMMLQDRLLHVGTRWVEEHQEQGATVTLETLSSRASSDGKLFKRIQSGRPILVPTFERVMRYLDTPSNWPKAQLPYDVDVTMRRELRFSLSVRS